eukprot:CAMPEP_0180785852 /NCGR_PEP_ID=MMETSP1038_2-20121128/50450_1 /TAXON_ID=632150 /ORGANISM="Azadinium spinosum, Strain 3D9" /LENGTH=45 /DNA_ID= /DNA_START= /DNA_END= /DNA_ORIENTATION=
MVALALPALSSLTISFNPQFNGMVVLALPDRAALPELSSLTIPFN